MKYLNIILLLISFNSFGQEFITDDNFDSKIYNGSVGLNITLK